ncbi:hypothetical protein [Bacillus phage SDFMU_Pbc]|uniref:Uncharacterized protein n=1 Tax=Bacillus phage SDFMU_Pbc TaxID=3076135 RepID=A0AA96QYD9_9CAUD|nr:hypothetical protein [Bacillus phage SDFMU_Pbc]
MDVNINSFDFDLIRLIDETGASVDYNLREELAVNEHNLLQEMLEQPAKFVYWASLLEQLKYYQESKELECERVTAQVDDAARQHYNSTGTKPTKDMVETYRRLRPEYEQVMLEYMQLKLIVGKVSRIVKAFEQRKDMLQSFGKQLAEHKFYGSGAGGKLQQ